MLELKILPYEFKCPKRETLHSGSEKLFRYFPPDSPPTTKSTPVSSAHGKIKTLVFTIPEYCKVRAYNLLPIIEEVTLKMQNTVQEIIIIHTGEKMKKLLALKKKFHPKPQIHLVKTNDIDKNLDVWAQDHFYPLKVQENEQDFIYWAIGSIDSGDSSTLTRLNTFQTRSNTLEKVKVKKTGLPFEGGNILAGEDFLLVGISDHDFYYKQWFGLEPIFVGYDMPNVKTKFGKKQAFKDGFYNQLPPLKHTKSRRETTLGQPLLHIDMFITLAGYNDDRTAYTIVVGAPQITPQVRTNADSDLLDALDHWLQQMKESINTCIQKLEKDLSSKLNVPINVAKIPLILSYKDRITPKKQHRQWFWVAYNNCLVEITEATNSSVKTKQVWFPSYGSPSSDYSSISMSARKQKNIRKKLEIDDSSRVIEHGNWTNLKYYDEAAAAKWSTLGFKVCCLEESYIPLIWRRGGLNCITNVIERL
ncbi:MAG: hypothetical protein ACRBFS_20795 [Aureispira sp.]